MPHKPRPSTPRIPSADRVSRTEATQAPGLIDEAAAVKPVTAADKIAPTQKAGAAERVYATTGASAVQPAEAVRGAAHSELVAGIAARLRVGQLTPAQAVEELIDNTVRANLAGLGTNDSNDKLGEQLRAELHAYVQHDPILLSRVRRLSKIPHE